MPIYEYVCQKCKKKFELMRPFSRSAENAKCPVCQNQADRIMSACVSMSDDASGVPKQLGSGGSCSSCSSGNCGSCGG
jgi:putative FmdB family regulatory protein